MNRKTLSTLIMAATMAIGGLGAANINSNKTSQRNEVLLSSASASSTASSNSGGSTASSNAKATASSNSGENTSSASASSTASSNSGASTASSSAKAIASSNSNSTNQRGQTEHKGDQGTSNKGGQTEHKENQGTSNKGGQTEHKGNQGTSNKGGQIEHKGNQEKPQVVPQQPLTTYDGLVSTNNKTINVMSAPTTIPSYSFVVGTLSNGKNVKIISKDNGYYEIEFGGSIGYVNASDVNTTATAIPTSTSVANSENSIKKNVNYPTTMKKYVAQQLKSYNEAYGNSLTKAQLENTTKQISEAVNPKAAATVFEFLNVNKYRNVNAQEFNQALQGKGVLQGQGQAFINAAKKYNLDPVYLLAQCALETGWGQSNFAKGTTITEVADMNAPIKNSKGQLIGYKMIKLKKTVTVYNLFGVGAYDNTKEFSDKATITAEAYAYNHGWTSVSSALQGAAEFIANNYVHNSKYGQNTPYALRYINGEGSSINHQYSTDINYGQTIGEIMKQYSYLYNANDKFSFGIPTFQSK